MAGNQRNSRNIKFAVWYMILYNIEQKETREIVLLYKLRKDQIKQHIYGLDKDEKKSEIEVICMPS